VSIFLLLLFLTLILDFALLKLFQKIHLSAITMAWFMFCLQINLLFAKGILLGILLSSMFLLSVLVLRLALMLTILDTILPWRMPTFVGILQLVLLLCGLSQIFIQMKKSSFLTDPISGVLLFQFLPLILNCLYQLFNLIVQLSSFPPLFEVFPVRYTGARYF